MLHVLIINLKYKIINTNNINNSRIIADSRI